MQQTPKHTEVYNTIKDAILSGRMGYGERLYNENWLCEALDVSRATLRKAVLKLVDDGYLEHRVNTGFYVSYLVPSAGEYPLTTIVERLRATGVMPSSKIFYFSINEAGERYAEIFGVEPEENVIEVRRFLTLDDEPFGVNHLVLLESVFPDFNPWLANEEMLHVVLDKYCGVEIVKSAQTADAVLATKEIARRLGVAYRTPLLHTRVLESTANGNVVERQESWMNVDRTPYSMRIDWSGLSVR